MAGSSADPSFHSSSSSFWDGAFTSQQSVEHQIRDAVRLIGQRVLLVRQHPRRHHLVEHAEERFRYELRMQVAAKHAGGLPLLHNFAEDAEVVADFLMGEKAHVLDAVAQLDLGDDGERAIASEGLEMMPDGDAHTLLGTSHRRKIALQ